MDFKKHKRKGALSELIQVQEFNSQGGDFTQVSISKPDKDLLHTNPDAFNEGFIARNPDNHNDMWYVSKEYYDKNLEEIKSESKEGLNFGQAIEAAKQGKRVARLGWNGQNMFAYIVPAASYPAQTGAAKAHFGEDAMVPYRAYWALKTAQEDVATWTPSGSDTLAEDWIILD
jgi:hypothetical protein